jgi:hypothetical protein
MIHLILLLHTAITWTLTGLIWTIQIVHYPLFELVGKDAFPTYHARHMWLITWVAGPLMLAEAASAALLWLLGGGSLLMGLSLLPLLAIWASTVIYQVRLHDHLTNGFHLDSIHQLIHTNWVRTLGWTLRSLCLLALLWKNQP